MLSAFNEEFLAAIGERRGREAEAHAKAVALMGGLGGTLFERRLFAHPLLFDSKEFAELGRATAALLSAQLKILRHLCETRSQEAVLDLFQVPRRLKPFIKWDNLRNSETTVARLDIVPTRAGYFVCELNVLSAVGGGEGYRCADLYFETLGYPRVALERCPLWDLAQMYTAQCRQRDMRRVVILDSLAHGQLGYPRQELLKRYLQEANPGLTVELLDEERYPKEWLKRSEGERTLVHRMFTYDEVSNDFAFFQKLWESGAFVTNGFEAELRMNKRFLAMLWEPGYHALFSDEEIATIRKYLPPAFALNEANLASAVGAKDEHVFKRDSCATYGGAGVLVGAEWSAAELEQKLREAGVDRWICQRAVEAEAVQMRTGDDVAPVDYRMVLGLYSYGGKPNGFFLRGSRVSRVVNVSNPTGRMGWAFVVSEEGRRALVRHARGEGSRRFNDVLD